MRRNRRRSGCWYVIPLLILFAVGAVCCVCRKTPQVPRHIYIDGYDILSAEGKQLSIGGGLAAYDSGTNTLRLTDVALESTCERGLEADRGLNLWIDGECRISAADAAVFVKGDLRLYGSGSLRLSGGAYGIESRGSLYLNGAVNAAASGGKAALQYRESLNCGEGYALYEGNTIAIGNALDAYSGQASVYIAAPCEITFDTWGGAELETMYVAQQSVIDTLPTPVRGGYAFAGWYTDENLTEPYTFPRTVQASLKLYAGWEKQCGEKLCGIDVSVYQGEMDWEAVAAAGVDFAIIRAGFRSSDEDGALHTDPNFDVNMEGALGAGVEVGAYFYSQAITVAEAQEEAEALIALLDGYTVTLPCAIDFEYASDANGLTGRLYDAALTSAQATEICLTFCRTLRAAGYTPMVYASASMLENALDWDALAAEASIWMADWSVQTAYNGPYDFWQRSETGTIPGISENVDLDVWYRD